MEIEFGRLNWIEWMNKTLCLVKLLYDEPHFVLITTGIAERAVD